jgi:hypothetical protein
MPPGLEVEGLRAGRIATIVVGAPLPWSAPGLAGVPALLPAVVVSHRALPGTELRLAHADAPVVAAASFRDAALLRAELPPYRLDPAAPTPRSVPQPAPAGRTPHAGDRVLVGTGVGGS